MGLELGGVGQVADIPLAWILSPVEKVKLGRERGLKIETDSTGKTHTGA